MEPHPIVRRSDAQDLTDFLTTQSVQLAQYEDSPGSFGETGDTFVENGPEFHFFRGVGQIACPLSARNYAVTGGIEQGIQFFYVNRFVDVFRLPGAQSEAIDDLVF